MTYYFNDYNQIVLYYQQTGDSEPLLNQYENFLNKYRRLFVSNIIDFQNYDIRYFLSCYMADKKDRIKLRRGKYHSKQTVKKAYQVLNYLKLAFKDYEETEIYHEIIIPFLECARRYKLMEGKNFSGYIYRIYKFALGRHLSLLLKNIQTDTFFYFDETFSNNPDWENLIIHEMEQKEELLIELEFDLSLNDPKWLSGKTAKEPFQQLTREERLILAKYYFEHYTDKEIGRLIGRNRRSINRTRNRLIQQLEKIVKKGEVKWIRLSES